MKTELFYLLLTTLLMGVLWNPVIIGRVNTRGPLSDENYRRREASSVHDWVIRADGTHINATENHVLFATVVFIAQFVGVSTPGPAHLSLHVQ